jgi:hypothetical protein
MARGGRRPGAGAPKGNVNGLRHGLYSARFYEAALIVAVIPELRLLFDAIAKETDRRERQRFTENLTAAYRAVLVHPDLADSIKRLVAARVRAALNQRENAKTQSSNQTAVARRRLAPARDRPVY